MNCNNIKPAKGLRYYFVSLIFLSFLFPCSSFGGNKISQEWADPIYRTLDSESGELVLGLNHTELYAGMDLNGTHKVIGATGIFFATDSIQIRDLSSMAREPWYGSYNINNNAGPKTFLSRKKIMDIAIQLEELDPGYPWIGSYAIDPVGTGWTEGDLITPSNVDELRCDGLVEYTYEYSGTDGANYEVWGKNGTIYDISRYPSSHNNIGKDEPCTEFSPIVQRGGAGGACTNLTVDAIVDNPTINIYQYLRIGKTFVTIRASDQSGIHKIRFKWGSTGEEYSALYPQHPTQDYQEIGTSTTVNRTLYYWVEDGAGNKTDDWQTKYISVRPATIIPTTPTIPSATDGTYSDKVVITWNASQDATSYEVYRATSSGGSKTLLHSSVAGTTFYNTSAVAGTTYYYWIKACNVAGCSGYSNYDTGYRNYSVLSAPSDVTASDGSFTTGITVSWTAVSGADYYDVWRATSAMGSKLLVSGKYITQTSTTFPDVDAVADRLYYYWVEACQTGGVCSGYSNYDTGYMGSVVLPMGQASDPYPSDGYTNERIRTDYLIWAATEGAEIYKVYFGTDSTPDSGEYLGQTSTLKKSISGLQYETTYYWRVDSVRDSEVVEGNVWQFTTRADMADEVPERAINPTPLDGENDVIIERTRLSWENGGGADSYDVYFGANRCINYTEDQFVGNTTNTFWDLPSLEPSSINCWMVKARNSRGTAHGTIWKFRTEPGIPDAPFWPHPDNAQSEISTASFFLSWTNTYGQNFDIYFGTDPTPDNGELVGNTEDSRWQIDSLQPGTTYYWQIVAKTRLGSTPGSVWSFSTWNTAPAHMEISSGGFSSQGTVGEDFYPQSKQFTVRNIGGEVMDFTATSTFSWLQLIPSSAILQPGEEVLVTTEITSDATLLPSGFHADSVLFKNITNGLGNTYRSVSLAVDQTHQPIDVKSLDYSYLAGALITSDGAIYVWGFNRSGSLGLGENVPSQFSSPVRLGSDNDWSEVSLFYEHGLAVKKDGRLFAWGKNSVGQLGLGDQINRYSPTQVGTDTDWAKVYTGASHSLAQKTDGRLYAFGNNGDGQLGLGDRDNRLIPVQIGTDTDWEFVEAGGYKNIAIKSDGKLYSWGNRTTYENSDSLVPAQIGVNTDWSSGSREGGFLAIRTDGSLYLWEKDTIGDYSMVRVGTENDWIQAKVGDNFYLAQKTDGRVFAWGDNQNGNLGLGDRVDRDTPEQLQSVFDNAKLFANGRSSFLISQEGLVFSWGSNTFGILAQGHEEYRELFPTEVNVNWAVLPSVIPEVTFTSVTTMLPNRVTSFHYEGEAKDTDGTVVKVEYSLDDGLTWQNAFLGYSGQQWFVDINLEVGDNVITIRAIDNYGNYSPPVISPVVTRLPLGSDLDGDGMDDQLEYYYGLDFTDPSDAELDLDNDNMINLFEIVNGLDPTNPIDAQSDPDNDGFSNIEEYLSGTDPQDKTSTPNLSHSALVLHIDSTSEEFYLTGSDSGSTDQWGQIFWDQPGYAPYNTIGEYILVTSEYDLYVGASLTTNAINMYMYANANSIYDFTATGDRYDYSWWPSGYKDILLSADGIVLVPTAGVGLDAVSVIIETSAVPVPVMLVPIINYLLLY